MGLAKAERLAVLMDGGGPPLAAAVSRARRNVEIRKAVEAGEDPGRIAARVGVSRRTVFYVRGRP